MKFKILMSLFGVVMAICGRSQVLIHTTGNSTNGPVLSTEYSVGEISITTILSGTQVVTQGLLQPNYLIISETQSQLGQLFSFMCWPNPTTGELFVDTDYQGVQVVEAYDAFGTLIIRVPFASRLNILNNFPPGNYLLQFKSPEFTKTIKIIKQ